MVVLDLVTAGVEIEGEGEGESESEGKVESDEEGNFYRNIKVFNAFTDSGQLF